METPLTRLLSGFLGGDDLFLTPGEDPCVAAIDLEAAAPVWKPSHDSITTAATTADGSAAVAQVSLRQDGHRDFLIFQANRKIVREAGITRYGTDAQALALNHDGTRVGFSGAWGGISARLVSTGEELPPLDQFDIGYTLGLAWHGSDPTELIGIFTRHGHRGMPGAQEWIVA